MSPNTPDSTALLQRMVDAVEKVRQRLVKAANALQAGGVPYAVIGGNAVAAWVATVDEAAVRNTQDVNILIKRQDLDAAKTALTAVGFVHRHAAGLDLFLDADNVSPRNAVHVAFAGEYVKAGEPLPNPDVSESTLVGSFRMINLDALVRIKLTAFRDKDRTHVRDMIGVGLIDQTWTGKLPPVLADRLQLLLDTPDG